MNDIPLISSGMIHTAKQYILRYLEVQHQLPFEGSRVSPPVYLDHLSLSVDNQHTVVV